MSLDPCRTLSRQSSAGIEPPVNKADRRTKVDADDNQDEVEASLRNVGTVHSSADEECVPLNREEIGKLRESMNPTPPPLNERKLHKDTFSFLIFCKPWSFHFLFAIGVFCVQITVFSLVAVDIINIQNNGNPFHFPPNVDSAVRVTEVLAIVIAVITQEDVRTALNLWRDGYDQQVFIAFHGTAMWKWGLSILLRSLEGLLSLFVTFLLIMQSNTVIDLLLNFTAMEFVSFLDEVSFMLVKHAYFGENAKKNAKLVSRTKYFVTNAGSNQIRWRIVLLSGILGTMLAAWGVVYHKQLQGDYLCRSVFVQFGDGFLPTLGTFSGVYTLSKSRHSHGRAMYQKSSTHGQAAIGYCEHEKSWTFAFSTDGSIDPCHWVARSSPTDSFDVVETPIPEWFVKADESRIVPLEPLRLSCYDCDRMGDLCGTNGSCQNRKCACDNGSYGLRCEFSQPCSTLEIDALSTEGFLASRAYSRNYGILQNGTASVYNRPVYLNQTGTSEFDIILFTGRRWVVMSSDLLNDFDTQQEGIEARNDLATYLTQSFHAHWSDYEVAFISEPADVDTTTDTFAPIGLAWTIASRKTGADEGIQSSDKARQPLDTVLLCAKCDDLNPCRFDNACRADGTCNCIDGTSGFLCQVEPLGNGFCNQKFNTPEFNYDGGDCCEWTCRSTADFSCGKDASGYVDMGYFFCKQVTQDWELSGDRIEGGLYSNAGFSVAVARSGIHLVVGEPGTNSVAIFDKVLSEWTPRGPPLTGPSGFGGSVAMSRRGSNNVVNNPLTLAPIRVAVGGDVFDCETRGCHRIGQLLFSESSVDLSEDGSTIALGGQELDASNAGVAVYRWNGGAWNRFGDLIDSTGSVRRGLSVENGISVEPGISVSLSGSGNIVAFGEVTINREWDSDGFAIFGGEVKVFAHAWNGSSWTRRDNPINRYNGFSCFEILTGDLENVFQQQSIEISDDGNILAVGLVWNYQEPDGVQVYEWEATDWVPKGDPIFGLGSGSVSLSSNGLTVAIGRNSDTRAFS